MKIVLVAMKTHVSTGHDFSHLMMFLVLFSSIELHAEDGISCLFLIALEIPGSRNVIRALCSKIRFFVRSSVNLELFIS